MKKSLKHPLRQRDQQSEEFYRSISKNWEARAAKLQARRWQRLIERTERFEL